jgi:hypothetical protein
MAESSLAKLEPRYRAQDYDPDQERDEHVLIDKLGEEAKKWAAQGKEAPTFDLCNVTVAGTNLFCAETKGIPRAHRLVQASESSDSTASPPFERNGSDRLPS